MRLTGGDVGRPAKAQEDLVAGPHDLAEYR